jgi:hypothetical protein
LNVDRVTMRVVFFMRSSHSFLPAGLSCSPVKSILVFAIELRNGLLGTHRLCSELFSDKSFNIYRCEPMA